jgi:large subunit ribosomal protein L21
MYAIIETGGKQHVVSPGEQVQVEKLPGEIGATVEFAKVLSVSQDDGQVLLGGDLTSAKVTGTIASHGRGKKVRVFKFKKRKQYRRHKGHRQDYTQVKIAEIAV